MSPPIRRGRTPPPRGPSSSGRAIPGGSSSDIRLYRGDFVARGASPTLYDDVRKAALADKDAATRVAHLYRDGEGGTAVNLDRYVGWLQYAAALGHAEASYELAVHYRKTSLPALAAPYEARAEELGFKAPAALDNIRK